MKRVVASIIFCICTSAGLHADERGHQLIEQMLNSVNEHLVFEGTFVFMQAGALDSMRIMHAVVDGRVKERMVALSGPAREVIREDDVVTCIFPDEKLVTVENTLSALSVPMIVPSFLNKLDGHYQVESAKREKIAGYACDVVAIRPLDTYRYGYQLCIEPKTGMLLRSKMFSAQGKLLEEVMFTHIQFMDAIEPEQLEPSFSLDDYTWKSTKQTNVNGQQQPRAWYVSSLPPGFSVTKVSQTLMSISDVPVEHVVLTDGLARVSIFIAKLRDSKGFMNGLINHGSVNAYTRDDNSHQVTVLGEVPVSTVNQIGSSFHFSGE